MPSPIEVATKYLGKHWGSQVFSALFAVLFGAAIIFLALILSGTTPYSVALNLLICLVGALSGWIVGMFFSPFDTRDKERFEYLGKSVAAFASGYLLSAVQPIITKFTETAAATPSSIKWVELGLFTSSFLLAAVVVFVSRSYSLQDEVKSAAPAPAPAPDQPAAQPPTPP